MRILVDNRVRASGATEQQLAALRALAEHDNPALAELPRLRASLAQRPRDKVLRARVAELEALPAKVRLWEETRSLSYALSVPRGLSLDVANHPALRGSSLISGIGEGDPLLRVWRPGELRLRRPLWEHQEAFLEPALREEQGILRAATGSGKTMTLLAVFTRLALPTLVVVPSQALAEQWVRTALAEVEGLRPEHVGVIGGGKNEVRPLTVAVCDSLAVDDCRRARELSRSFGVLLFDEVYGAAARTRFAVVDASCARYRFAAGDDERRKDEGEFFTYAAFGRVLHSVTRRAAEASGAIVPVRVRLVETGCAPPPWWEELDAYARGMRRTDLIRHLEADPGRSALLSALVVRAAREGQVLCFAHHVDHVRRMHADALAMSAAELHRGGRETAIPYDAGDLAGRTGFFLGGAQMAKERRETCARLRSGECRATFATYKALGKGVDLPGATRAVLASPIHNDREGVNQVLGRLCRSADGKQAPEAVVLFDERVFGPSFVRAFTRGGREVVVERRGEGPGGREVVTAREYLQEVGDGQARRGGAGGESGESAGSFFRKLGRRG